MPDESKSLRLLRPSREKVANNRGRVVLTRVEVVQLIFGNLFPWSPLLHWAAGDSVVNRPMKYSAVLLKDGGPKTYEATSVIAADNTEALKKVKEWTASLDGVAEDAWLQITLNGVGIRSLRPGEF